MTIPDFEEYETAYLAKGFDEVTARAWDANSTADTHRHPFAVEALVVEGDMWLTAGGDTRHLVPGDTFHLNLDEPHAERYGAEGATYWAARKYKDKVRTA